MRVFSFKAKYLQHVKLEIKKNLKNLKSQAEACNFIKKEALAKVFSCKFCEISKNTFFYRTSPAAASVDVTLGGRCGI